MTRASEVDKERMLELWEEGLSVADIAAEMSITTSAVYKIAIAAGFPERERGGRPRVDPTVEQIYEAAAAIRATWSEERMQQSRSGGWLPPVV